MGVFIAENRCFQYYCFIVIIYYGQIVQFKLVYIEFRNSMNEKNIMEPIAEESSRICSETNIRNQSESFELLIKAHDRIRQLEAENEQLRELLTRNNPDKLANLQQQVEKLRNCIEEKNLKIQNLERINQRAIYDYVLLEKQLQQCQEFIRHKRNATAIPSEMNSPLNLSKLNRGRLDNEEENDYHQSRGSINNAKQYLLNHERLFFNRSDSKTTSNMQLFTFDKENSQGFFKSPKNRGEKVLKNCFSEVEMNRTISKIYKREQEKSSSSKQNLKQYQNYCSSIQKKHSPCHARNLQFKKPQGNALKIAQGPIFVPCKHYGQNHNQKWIQTGNTRTCTSFYPNRDKVYPTFY